jgi:hypothetical protein
MEQGASAFAWPLAPGSVGAVAQGLDASGTYIFRASKAAKDAKKTPLLATCMAYNAALKAMQDWVTENAKMGITWNNAKGVAAKDYVAAPPATTTTTPVTITATPASVLTPVVTSTSSPAAAAAVATVAVAPAAAAPNLANLFSSISAIDQSSGKTEGLRHVTKDMKSSAQPAGVVKVPVVASAGGKVAAAPSGMAGVKMGAPKVAEEGMRVVVEYHTKESQAGATLTLSNVTLRQEVYIYGCK